MSFINTMTSLKNVLGNALITLLGFNQTYVSSQPERRKHALTAIALALPVTLAFSLVNYFVFDFAALAAVEAAVSLFLLLPALALLRDERYLLTAEFLILAYGTLVSTALIIYGGVEGTGVIWVFTYAFLAFFIKGQRAGWLYCLGWVAFVWVMVKLSFAIPDSRRYSDVYLQQLVSALLFYSAMAAAFNLVRSRFEADLHDRVEANTARARAYLDQLQYLALHDETTGLPNRTHLISLLDEAIGECQGENEAIVLIDLRLERLFEISNILGDRGGDQLMQSISFSLLERYGEKGRLARLRRDEFGFFYKTDLQHVSPRHIMEMVGGIQLTYHVDSYPIHIEHTMGIAIYPRHSTRGSDLLRMAEQAMLQARADKEDVSIYNEELNASFVRRNLLFGQLRQALSNKELSLVYQPQIDLRSGKIVGAEALARWRKPNGEYVPPGDFIPVAENSGLIRPFTKWLIIEFFQQLAEWQRDGLDIHCSVNLSARNLADPELISDLRNAMSRYAVPANKVVLEITECSFSDSPDQFMQTVDKLHRMGFQQSIDDFGTGYSSLSYLKDLRVNELKIDQSFVTNLLEEPSCSAIVKTTIQLAHNLGLKVVAEGIESEDVARLLARYGCDVGQGYVFSKPLSPEQFRAFAATRVNL